jgi:hypothetical protein
MSRSSCEGFDTLSCVCSQPRQQRQQHRYEAGSQRLGAFPPPPPAAANLWDDNRDKEQEEYKPAKKVRGYRPHKKHGSHKKWQHRKQAGHMTYSAKANAEYKKEQKQQQKEQQKAQQTVAQHENQEEVTEQNEVQPEASTTSSGNSEVIEVPLKTQKQKGADSSKQVRTPCSLTSVCAGGAAFQGGCLQQLLFVVC